MFYPKGWKNRHLVSYTITNSWSGVCEFERLSISYLESRASCEPLASGGKVQSSPSSEKASSALPPSASPATSPPSCRAPFPRGVQSRLLWPLSAIPQLISSWWLKPALFVGDLPALPQPANSGSHLNTWFRCPFSRMLSSRSISCVPFNAPGVPCAHLCHWTQRHHIILTCLHMFLPLDGELLGFGVMLHSSPTAPSSSVSTWHAVSNLTITEWFVNEGNNEWINITFANVSVIAVSIPAFSLAKWNFPLIHQTWKAPGDTNSVFLASAGFQMQNRFFPHCSLHMVYFTMLGPRAGLHSLRVNMWSYCAFGSGRVSWLMSVTEPPRPSPELAGVPSWSQDWWKQWKCCLEILLTASLGLLHAAWVDAYISKEKEGHLNTVWPYSDFVLYLEACVLLASKESMCKEIEKCDIEWSHVK